MVKITRCILRNPFGSLVLVAGLLAAGYYAEVMLVRQASIRLVVGDITYPVLNGLSALMLLAAALSSARHSKRMALAWGSFCLAQVFFSLGDATWAVLELGLGVSPYPSLADVFYLLYYPLFMAGIVLLPASRVKPSEMIKRVLDLALIIVASMLLAWTFIIGPQLHASQLAEPWLVQVLSVAYPTGDLIIIWGLLLLMYKRVQNQPILPLLFLGAAGLAMIFTDTFYISRTLSHNYASGGLLDGGWVVVYLLSGLAGAAQVREITRGSSVSLRFQAPYWMRRFPYLLPYLWVLGAYGLEVAAHLGVVKLNTPWVALGDGLIMLLVVARQVIALEENHGLLAQLNHALERVRWQADELEKSNNELMIEITERKRIERQLAFDALHDSLTGLPNRVLCLDRLAHSIEFARRRSNYSFAVLFLDLDYFKVINDSLGHAFGDQLLARIAERLKKSVRASDTVARLSGDEFVILLEDVRGDEVAIDTVERILHTLSQPFNVQGHEVVTSCSVGVVTHTSEYDSPQDILRDADIAMYRAKLNGKGQYAVFSPDLHTQAMARLQLENELRHAVERHEFQLVYQPIYDLDNERVVGFEALVRWLHPHRGLLLPGDFIAVAEETGLILPLGRWVLRQACLQMSRWQQVMPGAREMVMNVNISSRQFAQRNFIEQLESILREACLSPRSLRLEITERVVIDHQQVASNVFERLGKLGVQTQLDDFGTGYSSLSYLQHLPIQGIKIDKSFIQQVSRSGKNIDLVRTILNMARDLGVSAVAEGIETEEQLAMLKTLSCHFGQGYLLGRPLDRGQVEKLLVNTSLNVCV